MWRNWRNKSKIEVSAFDAIETATLINFTERHQAFGFRSRFEKTSFRPCYSREGAIQQELDLLKDKLDYAKQEVIALESEIEQVKAL